MEIDILIIFDFGRLGTSLQWQYAWFFFFNLNFVEMVLSHCWTVLTFGRQGISFEPKEVYLLNLASWQLLTCARGSCARNFEKEQHLSSLVKIEFSPCPEPSLVDSFHLDFHTFSPKMWWWPTWTLQERSNLWLCIGQRENPQHV